ncbi:enoyl-CoA hydratase-related protein [Nocardia sp. NPDC050799]|uniref:enoyl-CoA hydratase-related protein n=1 Tax=Nocardia sp. NPDC050799 TaxID=3154842 RepID=UPI00340827B7
MTAASEGVVRTERHDHVLLIRINRPERLNAVDRAVARGIGDAIEEAETDPRIRAVVLTGTGRAFCAGADLKASAAGEAINHLEEPYASWRFAGFVRHPRSVPVIAAVNGLAHGGGMELVLASELAVAADTATFALSEVAHGVIAGGGAAIRLIRHVPDKVAMHLLLTGDRITAGRALELGVVNEVVPPDQVLSAAMSLAHKVAGMAPLAVQATTRLAAAVRAGQREDELWERSRSESRALHASADAIEGKQAFVEKRAPHWRAR